MYFRHEHACFSIYDHPAGVTFRQDAESIVADGGASWDDKFGFDRGELDRMIEGGTQGLSPVALFRPGVLLVDPVVLGANAGEYLRRDPLVERALDAWEAAL